jgi:hypothetical protein
LPQQRGRVGGRDPLEPAAVAAGVALHVRSNPVEVLRHGHHVDAVHDPVEGQVDGEQQPVAAAAAGMVNLLCASGAGCASDSPELRIASRTWKCQEHELDLAAWRIGPAVIVGAPTELFASLSRDLRNRIAGPLIVATLCNGWTGYWPDRPAFGEGKYEVNGSWGLQPGDGEALIQELALLAAQVRQAGQSAQIANLANPKSQI